MKYIVLFISLFLFGIKGYSQTQSKYIGAYTRDDDKVMKLFVLPDNKYVSIIQSLEIGTWKECDDNLILYPPQREKNMLVQLYGRYDDKFPVDSIFFNFKGLEDTPILYSFNNDDNKSAMHSVYNLFPNCFNLSNSFAVYMSTGAVKKDQKASIQLMYVPDIYGNLDFSNSKDSKFIGSISGQQQSFLLPPQYNDYQIVFGDSDSKKTDMPVMATLHENNLYFEGHFFAEKNALQNFNKAYLDSLLILDGKLDLNPRKFSEYRYNHGYQDWVDYEYQLITDNSLDSNKTVNFDLKYLITENCNNIVDDDNYYREYRSVIIDEYTRKEMSFWKTFQTRLVNNDIDRLVTMINFPLKITTEDDSIGTKVSKEDFLANLDQLFSPNVIMLFKECNFNSFLKDTRYRAEFTDEEGIVYRLDSNNYSSISIDFRGKDQIIEKDFILKEKNGSLKLDEVSIQK